MEVSGLVIDSDVAQGTIEAIESHYELFDMKNWLVSGHDFGTAGCLAIWICVTGYELNLPEDLSGCEFNAGERATWFLTGRTRQELETHDPDLLRDVECLFHSHGWPKDLRDTLDVAQGRRNSGSITPLDLQRIEAGLACQAMARFVDKYAPSPELEDERVEMCA